MGSRVQCGQRICGYLIYFLPIFSLENSKGSLLTMNNTTFDTTLKSIVARLPHVNFSWLRPRPK